MKTKIGIALVVCCLGLTGCTTEGSDHPRLEAEKRYSIGHETLREVRLEDGTRCIVMTGPYKGGISCDFSKRPD
jgi:hypothetical protein